jgi:hypothetical protein
MSKKLVSLLFALAMVFAAAAVAVSPARADDDDDDDGGGGATPAMAFGDFTTNFLGTPNQHVVFTATDGGPPASDSGTIDYTNPGVVQYTANLVCVSIVGATARFGYVIPPGHPGLSGLNIIWQVTDGDLLPGAPPDTAGFAVVPDATLCDIVGAPETPITSGEITVVPAGVGGGGDDDDDDDDDEDDEDDEDDDDDDDEDEDDD